MRKKILSKKYYALILLLGFIQGGPTVADAQQASVRHTVTVCVVKPTLGLHGDVVHCELAFDDTHSKKSKKQQVNYSFKANQLQSVRAEGVILAKLSQGSEAFQVVGDVGAFYQLGSEDNARLSAIASGPQKLSRQQVALVHKAETMGEGGIAHGILPVTWQAISEGDLPLEGVHEYELQITVKDI